MKKRLFLCLFAMFLSCISVVAQQSQTSAQSQMQPLTFWYGYTVNPGKEDEFLDIVFEFVVNGQNGSYSPARSSFRHRFARQCLARFRTQHVFDALRARTDTNSRFPAKKEADVIRSLGAGCLRFRFRLGRPRAAAHVWGKGARILTEINRLTQLISPPNSEIAVRI